VGLKYQKIISLIIVLFLSSGCFDFFSEEDSYFRFKFEFKINVYSNNDTYMIYIPIPKNGSNKGVNPIIKYFIKEGDIETNISLVKINDRFEYALQIVGNGNARIWLDNKMIYSLEYYLGYMWLYSDAKHLFFYFNSSMEGCAIDYYLQQEIFHDDGATHKIFYRTDSDHSDTVLVNGWNNVIVYQYESPVVMR
jgi:hypothetical protein